MLFLLAASKIGIFFLCLSSFSSVRLCCQRREISIFASPCSVTKSLLLNCSFLLYEFQPRSCHVVHTRHMWKSSRCPLINFIFSHFLSFLLSCQLIPFHRKHRKPCEHENWMANCAPEMSKSLDMEQVPPTRTDREECRWTLWMRVAYLLMGSQHKHFAITHDNNGGVPRRILHSDTRFWSDYSINAKANVVIKFN